MENSDQKTLLSQAIQYHQSSNLDLAFKTFKKCAGLYNFAATYFLVIAIRHGHGCVANEKLAFEILSVVMDMILVLSEKGDGYEERLNGLKTKFTEYLDKAKSKPSAPSVQKTAIDKDVPQVKTEPDQITKRQSMPNIRNLVDANSIPLTIDKYTTSLLIYEYAIMHLYAYGCPKNTSLGLHYLTISSKLENPDAHTRLAEIYELGHHNQKINRPKAAIHWRIVNDKKDEWFWKEKYSRKSFSVEVDFCLEASLRNLPSGRKWFCCSST